MEKREFVLSILFLFLIINISLASSAEGNLSKAYDCLKSQIGTDCSKTGLSLDAKIFSLLVLRDEKCRSQIIAASKKVSETEECWPALSSSSTCSVKTTAQVILAMDKMGYDTEKAKKWLLAQKGISSALVWYLQIDSEEATTCTITFGGNDLGGTKNGVGEQVVNLKIGLDKKITELDGTCFSKDRGDYWLKINANCYREFHIECDKTFLTNLIYKENEDSSVFFILDSNTPNSEGETIESIKSYCLKQENKCDYEATLWAAFAFSYVGNTSSADSLVPYLKANSEKTENSKYLPDAFLYYLTADSNFRDSLLSKPKYIKSSTKTPPVGYWQVSSDKFYDTAVAVLSLTSSQDESAKTRAQNWFLQNQDTSGCWKNNANADIARDTALILFSAWDQNTFIPKECYDDSNCDTGKKCFKGQCVLNDTECLENTEKDDCTDSLKPVCDNSKCVPCIGDSDCSNNTAYCSEEGDYKCACEDNQCVQCSYPEDCSNDITNSFFLDQDKTFCLLDDFLCVQCLENDDCLDGKVCSTTTHTCVPCKNTDECDSGKVCNKDLTPDKCVDCSDDDLSNCAEGEFCSGSGTCVECTPTSGNCGIEKECSDTGECENKCSTTKPCASGYCLLTKGYCVDCFGPTGDSQCVNASLGKKCTQNNTCVSCLTANDCDKTKNQICDASNLCRDQSDHCLITGCRPGDVCDNSTGKCEECLNNTPNNCSSGRICVNKKCVPADEDECTLNTECKDTAKPICDDNGVCVAETPDDCEQSGYYCRSLAACNKDEGTIVNSLVCTTGFTKCCSVAEQSETCSDLHGLLCTSSETCSGLELTASDASCCVQGICTTSTPTASECETNGGHCRTTCLSNETSNTDDCDYFSDYCCVKSSTPTPGGSLLWLWILLGLIVLVLIGILFRNKLRMLLFRLKSGKSSTPPRRPGFPPPFSGTQMARPQIQRRILPPQQRPAPRPQQERPKGEMDDVLKKLKELGK